MIAVAMLCSCSNERHNDSSESDRPIINEASVQRAVEYGYSEKDIYNKLGEPSFSTHISDEVKWLRYLTSDYGENASDEYKIAGFNILLSNNVSVGWSYIYKR